ncbi:uncharacterized protein LOC129409417 [Boleophthalmus pectinirostris]|uniref:uncharacterized protein LOC129409417 n=1 Tax=Boleophthalmus pectinirostris TaxID=150288 RepID=UPI00242DDB7A|nr:uncharacterized protein LOC129409417 [Boleophthalmus pectinirostris]
MCSVSLMKKPRGERPLSADPVINDSTPLSGRSGNRTVNSTCGSATVMKRGLLPGSEGKPGTVDRTQASLKSNGLYPSSCLLLPAPTPLGAPQIGLAQSQRPLWLWGWSLVVPIPQLNKSQVYGEALCKDHRGGAFGSSQMKRIEAGSYQGEFKAESIFGIQTAKSLSVSCIIRETCFLPCSIDDQISTLHWAKHEGSLVVHGFQYDAEWLEKQALTFRGRTSLFLEQFSGGNASLQLSDVKVSDEGTYRCLAVSASGFGQELDVHLSVEGPVASVLMELKGDVLVCSSEGIYPQPNMSWAPDSAHQTRMQPMENQLYSISSSLSFDPDPPQRYTCNVSTHHSWKSATYSLHPPVEMSSNVTLPCSISSAPVKSLKWTFNYIHNILSQSEENVTYATPWRPFVVGVSKSGSLSLKELSPEKTGVFLCEGHTDDHIYISRTQLKPTKGPADPPVSSATVSGVTVFLLLLVIITIVIVIGFFLWRRKKVKEVRRSSREAPDQPLSTLLLHIYSQFMH